MTNPHNVSDFAGQHEPLAPQQKAAGSALGTRRRDRLARSRVQININPQVAGCGCFALSSLPLLAGSVLLLVVVWAYLIPDWRTNNKYLPNSCLVLDKRLDSHTSEVHGPRGQRRGTQEVYCPEIKIRYEVDNRTFEVWTYDGSRTYTDRDSQQAILDSFEVGATYPCWHDPDRPDQAVLVRGHSLGAYLFLILPVGLLLVGAIGTFIAWKTAKLPPSQVAAGDGNEAMDRSGKVARWGGMES